MFGELVPVGGGDPNSVAQEESVDWAAGELRHRAEVLERLGPSLPIERQYGATGTSGICKAATGLRSTGCASRTSGLIRATFCLSPSTSTKCIFAGGTWRGRPSAGRDARPDVFKKSLLERAGLEQRKPGAPTKSQEPEPSGRYDVTNNEPGQLRFRHHPI